MRNNNVLLNKLKIQVNKIKFKSLNLNFEKQLVLIGSILGITSLFFDWIIYPLKDQSWNAFNSITGNIGYLLLVIFLLPIFVILSTQYKEKIKLYSELNFKNHFIVITAALVSVSFSIISISFASGLKTFLDKIVYGSGPILSMTAGLLLLTGGILIRNEFNKNNSEIILEKLNSTREKVKQNDNMSLPI